MEKQGTRFGGQRIIRGGKLGTGISDGFRNIFYFRFKPSDCTAAECADVRFRQNLFIARQQFRTDMPGGDFP